MFLDRTIAPFNVAANDTVTYNPSPVGGTDGRRHQRPGGTWGIVSRHGTGPRGDQVVFDLRCQRMTMGCTSRAQGKANPLTVTVTTDFTPPEVVHPPVAVAQAGKPLNARRSHCGSTACLQRAASRAGSAECPLNCRYREAADDRRCRRYLAMGGYAAFVWSADGVALAVLGGLAWHYWRRYRTSTDALAKLQREFRTRL